jgi:hypothetical protein
MISDRLTKRMIDVQKSTFEMMLNMAGNIQEKSGQATQAYFEQMAGLPQEGVKIMGHWMNSMKQTRTEFDSIVRDNFENWGNMFEKTMQYAKESARQSQQKVKQHGK